ncbi:MAG TPA: DUF222 domain-containing protein [Aeromicrobium sp.]|nr:DUF222 domain-containing protein [Aeromicrobium sp.]
MDIGGVVEQLQSTAAALDALPDTAQVLRELEAAKNAITAAQARLVVELADSLAHEDAGYSSPKAFLRAELGLDTRAANELIAAGPTMRRLPDVGQAADIGAISLDHVKHFTYCLSHVGEDVTRRFLPELVDVAAKAEPASLRMVVRKLREAVYPDDLDQKWIDGMAKEDISLDPVPDGWHVTGFLNSVTGAKLKTVLQSLSAPSGANDPRSSAQRRVDGLEQLLDGVLHHGLPGDRGVRPHITLTVDAQTLRDDEGSGELVGFGPVGVRQVKEILCGGQITPVVVDRSRTARFGSHKLGRTVRLASAAQRLVIETEQRHRCAAPGCANPIVHVHHVVWWSDGGTTDLDNLIGLCPRCHRAVHAGTMVIDPDTHEFYNRDHLLLRRADRRHRPRRRLTEARVRRARYRNQTARAG